MPELVGDRGMVLEGNNVEDLTRAIERLLVSPELRRQLGWAGKGRVSHFSTDPPPRPIWNY